MDPDSRLMSALKAVNAWVVTDETTSHHRTIRVLHRDGSALAYLHPLPPPPPASYSAVCNRRDGSIRVADDDLKVTS